MIDKVREEDLPSLMIKDGIKLRHINGTSYKGLCPFHEDTNPSLSVNLKGKFWLWHCFGCDAGGDIIRYIMLKDNSAFGDAVKSILPDYGKYETDIPKTKIIQSVAEHYHEVLKTNKKAQDYLQSRGLHDPEIIKEYKIGFCDGSLPKDMNLRQSLFDLGILTAGNREHFHNCITFPIHDEKGRIISLYGRNINKSLHLYLKGPHQGIFNYKRAKTSKEIYIAESIIDALSLIKLGFKSTIALFGANGFTDDHNELLKYSDIDKVTLCLDNDTRGQKAQENLIAKVPQSIKHVYRMDLPKDTKDPNDFLLGGGTKEALLKNACEV